MAAFVLVHSCIHAISRVSLNSYCLKAVSEGHTDIAAIAISCNDAVEGAVSSPCGACRQFMAEFGE